ncbi:opioid-binding protein/cell adhesion molecule homolog isoform X2 [Actinia tenebrosa]|uniref:Opioid-binding protein/cell adhesion molecule homolog isoform X2 n=1 Tax=Actinia tenebrosa TaxID=6105 RepID=A0A6P8IS02_ACTTE|nr:opioid-binding protein/cell adhesion molecule homolog isoform X2 [Actinia tenebrosa]
MFMKRRPAICQCRTLLFFIVLLLKTAIVAGDGRFKPDLKSVILVQNGTTAYFEWDYTVDNRVRDFNSLSPIWSFYNSTNHEFIIGHENRANAWAWEVTRDTCPPRLLYPKERVHKTSVATLVITDVTTADNGIYECTLSLSSPKKSRMELIVSVTPQISLNVELKILENDNLTAICLAIGPPAPNVTWIRSGNTKELAFGINGSAVLKIYNIKRNQGGIYECLAINNPTEQPVKNQTNVIVQYCEEFNEIRSTKFVKAHIHEKNVELKSVADGVPVPTHVWYLPNKKMVHSENSTESTYTIKEVNEEHIGNWTINITNWICSSYYVHRLEVIKVPPSHEEEKCFTSRALAGIIIGAILAVLIIVAVIAFVIYKIKFEKKPFTEVQKRGILIGLIVAVVIIIIIIIVVAIQLNKCG